jgi:hypothetical protein
VCTKCKYPTSCYLCTSHSWLAACFRCMMSIETRENKGYFVGGLWQGVESPPCLETAEKLGDIINHLASDNFLWEGSDFGGPTNLAVYCFSICNGVLGLCPKRNREKKCKYPIVIQPKCYTKNNRHMEILSTRSCDYNSILLMQQNPLQMRHSSPKEINFSPIRRIMHLMSDLQIGNRCTTQTDQSR